ncbi:aspartate/glutamate racemase family protein [Ferrimonas balearica]|uniref:aspartate/glutamate racemase family protein n=1 Tax=Ferrimonas balearica TaxID=44012 RepID=UPI001C572C44|nr:aspartate/glutamate racemase family protein [Ferrimonas balearica]MBW3140584.1 aspartate/glutamate racemase family protein [Ferrimonas balearica]MBY6107613.1 aspartate/glutamate racemase family protein [Ferrimonas balearica]
MKTLGLLGGMSWESTVSYYQALNRGVQARLGGLHSAKVLINSVDFAEIAELQHHGEWEQTAERLAQAAQALERAGAEGLLIGTNTMHKVAPQIANAISIPLLHIADATGARLQADGITCVALLGTRFTMEQAFYRERLEQHFGIEVRIPDAAERDRIHRVIYDELCQGRTLDNSRQDYVAIIERLHREGAQGAILGCTEIALLVKPEHTSVPLFDTTALHAEAAVEWALGRQ